MASLKRGDDRHGPIDTVNIMKKRLAALAIGALALGACSGGGSEPEPVRTGSLLDQINADLEEITPGLSQVFEDDLILELVDGACQSSSKAEFEEFEHGFRRGMAAFDQEMVDGIFKAAVDAGCPYMWDRT